MTTSNGRRLKMQQDDYDESALRLPPQALEAEQSVLGSMMLSNDLIDDVASTLDVRDFYRNDHQVIYETILHLDRNHIKVDAITVHERLTEIAKNDYVGGLHYLGLLAKNTPNTSNALSYAKVIRDRAIRRRVIEVGNKIIATGYQPYGKNAEEIVSDAEEMVGTVANESGSEQTYKDFNSVLSGTIDKLEEMVRNESEISGLATGYDELDKLTAGLQNSDLIIIAGRPSMGKTSFAMNIMEYVAIGEKKPVGIFSMEMPAEQLATRILSSLSQVEMQRLKSGTLRDEDWTRVTSTWGLLQNAPFYIDDAPALTISELRRRAKKMNRDCGGLSVIMLDYLQLMRSVEGDNETEKIGYLSRGLKVLAKELNVPVIALSQLNRSLETRPDKRPIMSDIRASGAIEQDADLILFVYRDEIYNEDSQFKGTAEIIIGKQRNGPLGKVRLTFMGQYTRFENYKPPSFS